MPVPFILVVHRWVETGRAPSRLRSATPLLAETRHAASLRERVCGALIFWV
jgi:hypothetical protein